MEKMDKIQCKYIEDYPDIQKSSIHISSETKKNLEHPRPDLPLHPK